MVRDRVAQPLEMVASLASHGDEFDGHGLVDQEPLGLADDAGIERPAQAAVGGDENQRHAFHGALRHQRMTRRAAAGGDNVLEDLGETIRVGPRGFRLGLGATETGRGDHVHRLGDLADVLDALDAAADVAETGHDNLLRGEQALEFVGSLLEARHDFLGEFLAVAKSR